MVSALAADPQLGNLLATVEARYNHAKTLQVIFQEQYTRQGEPHRAEGGRLQLRKPGKMRWDYTEPQGKLFVCDGKYLYLYTPADNRAQRMKLKETDDMRAPLAFLLGKLHFEREFRNLQAHSGGRELAHHGANRKPTIYRTGRLNSWWRRTGGSKRSR